MELTRCTSCLQYSPTLIPPALRHQTTPKPNFRTIFSTNATVSTTRLVVKARGGGGGGGAAEAETAVVKNPKVIKRFQVSGGPSRSIWCHSSRWTCQF
ncbi:hypothetical protein F3Y22_tig00002880pilonHSYRG00123 [Hibiscus syriacus]|uniref:Uncharacterized protein n=1 Tax=Hibiscus syriacus TaxID=106335 RepID=A0A6A3CQQ3_HIBSY|nr:hypothetical protein F3Y22_tig00002880pilonHSYRG00123 [Hibiscus syriacus]